MRNMIDVDSENFSQELIEFMISIGFILTKCEYTGIGNSREYKYYTPKFTDLHYTMIVFKHDIGNDTDFRLYIHRNSNGSYVDADFQVSTYSRNNRQYILSRIKDKFNDEILSTLRDITINKILCE